MGRRDRDDGVNTSSHVQVLGVGTDTGCTVPSVLLFFDRKRYLFNVGEGFQRFCVEHKVKMTKVTSILSTRVTTHTLGGLPGLLLTLRDASAGGLLLGHSNLEVHGPSGLNTAFGAFKYFVNVKEMGLRVKQFGEQTERVTGLAETCDPVVQNEAVTIRPIVVRPKLPAYNQTQTGSPKTKKARLDESQGGRKENSTSHVEDIVACYVCQLPDIPGKFLPQKAASLGVPRGPLYGQLVKGQTVTANNGKKVSPEEVMEPSTPGPTVIIVDCPGVEFIEGLMDTQSGLGAWSKDSLREKVATIVHLTPRDILRHPKYKQFISWFPDPTQHILVTESSTVKNPVMKKSSILHTKLHLLDPALFPALHNYIEEPYEYDFQENCRPGKNMLKYRLRPVVKRGFDEDECEEEIDYEQVITDLKNQKPELEEICNKIKNFAVPTEGSLVPPAAVTSPVGSDIQVTFLGTGAAVPSKYRNVTGILLQFISRHASILMDCGEGSLGQLYKRFGQKGTEDILRRLKFIWISHIHADHHVGLPAILGARTRLLGPECDPLMVVGPRPLRKSLQLSATLEPMAFAYVEASATEATSPGDTPPPDIKELMNILDLKRLESIRVVHCAHAFGFILESKDFNETDPHTPGWKIVFSGDTRPCLELINAAKNATLLIHEATFDDSMLEEAEEKKHSTTSEAITVGRDANAYHTLLTHFSQRYPKIPVIDESFSGHVGVAFDLMTVRLQDLPRLPLLVPAVKLLFDEAVGDDDHPITIPDMNS